VRLLSEAAHSTAIRSSEGEAEAGEGAAGDGAAGDAAEVLGAVPEIERRGTGVGVEVDLPVAA